MKAYQKISIKECGEPLIAIPLDKFIIEFPPPYQKLGADYGDKSPYYLREGVLDALIKAQEYLQMINHSWKIKIFDAYRPLQVQQFMVDYTFNLILQEQGLKGEDLTLEIREVILAKVYQFWAIPSDNPATPPPHSTGAAVDVTLVDEEERNINMGGEIDEVAEISYPNFYENSSDLRQQEYHYHRVLLNQIMEYAGFLRHPNEWWHFSLGDQLWVWLYNQRQVTGDEKKLDFARYGGVGIRD
jgi:D-alanyl-D-alanine dipeptidase